MLPTPSNNDIENGKKEIEADQVDKANCTTPLNPNNQKIGNPSFTDRLKDKITVSDFLKLRLTITPLVNSSKFNHRMQFQM